MSEYGNHDGQAAKTHLPCLHCCSPPCHQCNAVKPSKPFLNFLWRQLVVQNRRIGHIELLLYVLYYPMKRDSSRIMPSGTESAAVGKWCDWIFFSFPACVQLATPGHDTERTLTRNSPYKFQSPRKLIPLHSINPRLLKMTREKERDIHQTDTQPAGSSPRSFCKRTRKNEPNVLETQKSHVLSITGECYMSSSGYEECGICKNARLGQFL